MYYYGGYSGGYNNSCGCGNNYPNYGGCGCNNMVAMDMVTEATAQQLY